VPSVANGSARLQLTFAEDYFHHIRFNDDGITQMGETNEKQRR
jgi:hypothetical protein